MRYIKKLSLITSYISPNDRDGSNQTRSQFFLGLNLSLIASKHAISCVQFSITTQFFHSSLSNHKYSAPIPPQTSSTSSGIDNPSPEARTKPFSSPKSNMSPGVRCFWLFFLVFIVPKCQSASFLEFFIGPSLDSSGIPHPKNTVSHLDGIVWIEPTQRRNSLWYRFQFEWYLISTALMSTYLPINAGNWRYSTKVYCHLNFVTVNHNNDLDFNLKRCVSDILLLHTF